MTRRSNCSGEPTLRCALRYGVAPCNAGTAVRARESASDVVCRGAARSGTTALQTALNASDDVFLLGEANFFRENLKRGFRARYNARHQVFGFPPSKQTIARRWRPRAARGWIPCGLLAQHRLVGETIAFGAFEPDQWVSEFLAFQRRYFPAAAYILAFAIRGTRFCHRPRPGRSGADALGEVLHRGHARPDSAALRLSQDGPGVPETIEPATVLAIERCLDCPMPQFSALMFSQAASPPDPARIPAELRETMTELDLLYPVLREAAVSVEGSGSGPALAASMPSWPRCTRSGYEAADPPPPASRLA